MKKTFWNCKKHFKMFRVEIVKSIHCCQPHTYLCVCDSANVSILFVSTCNYKEAQAQTQVSCPIPNQEHGISDKIAYWDTFSFSK